MGEVVFIDELRRKRWLNKLNLARQTGEIVVFNSMPSEEAKIIDFPTQSIDTNDILE